MKAFAIALMACLIVGIQKVTAESLTVPGNPDTPQKVGKVFYTGHILPALNDYMTWVFNPSLPANHIDAPKVKREDARRVLIETIRQYPDEVNDILYACDTYCTPLFGAMQLGDVELVKILLEAGAIPFGPTFDDAHFLNITMENGAPLPAEIVSMIKKARQVYNPLQLIIEAQKAGIPPKGHPRKEHQ